MKLRWFLVLGLCGALFAAEAPTPEFQKSMKDLAAFSSSVDKSVADSDFDAVTKQAAAAKSALEVVAAYFAEKKTDAAQLESVRSAIKMAGDLSVTAGLKSQEGTAYSAKMIKGSCGGCHTAHRDKAADGSFQIK